MEADTEPASASAPVPASPSAVPDAQGDRPKIEAKDGGVAPSDQKKKAATSSLARFGKTSYSQNYEDIYIARAFHDVEVGFYIDVGAYHPKFDSITKIFYDSGWSGINIEPGPVFEELRRERPRDVNLRTAITGDGRDATYLFHPSAPGTSGLNAVLPPGLDAVVDRREAAAMATTTLEAVVAEHAPDRAIHFLKLDCEGVEAEIINATDWRALRPELLVVEAVRPNTNDRVDGAWRDTLLAADYAEVFFDGINVYYLRAESMARASAFDRAFNVLDGLEKPDYAAIAAIARLEEECGALNAALTETRDRAAHMAAAATADREAHAAALADAAAARDALTARLTATEADRDAHAAALAEAAAARDALTAALTAAEADRDLLRRQLTATEIDRDAHVAALAEATAARGALTARLAEVEAERETMAEAADALADRLSDARATIDAVEAAAWRDQRLRDAITAERDAARAALDALRARQRAVETTLRDPAAGRALRWGLALARVLRGMGVR